MIIPTNRYTTILLLFVSIFLCRYSSAQRFPFYNLTVEQGLIQSQATCLAQDKLGNLWIGTLGGLSRYDGKKIKSYTVSDGLYANNISDIEMLRDSILLISTGNSVQFFDGNRFGNISLPKGFQTVRVLQITVMAGDQIYCLLNGSLAKIDWAKKRITIVDSSRIYLSIQVIDQRLLLSDADGQLIDFDINRKHKTSLTTKVKDFLVLKIFKDSKNRVWYLTNKGLYRLQDTTLKPYTIGRKELLPAPLISAAEDKQGNLWLASVHGVFRIKDSSLAHFSQRNGLSNNVVNELLCDKEGNIWMCTDGEGVFRYSGGPFISFDEQFGLPNKQVTSIAGDKNGTIYFASYQGGLSAYRLGESLSIINTQILGNDIIISLAYQHGKGLWIATRSSGLFLCQNGIIRKFKHQQWPINANNISCLMVDGRNKLHVGFAGGFLSLAENDLSVYATNLTTPICLAEIGEDSVLMSTRSGFFLLDHSGLKQWRTSTLLDQVEAQSIQKKGSCLYIGTSEKGILVYHLVQKSVKAINTKTGLSSDFIYNLLIDSNGHLWAGTGRGICKIQHPDLAQPKITIYGKANGVIGLESNSSASYSDNYGQIWFGTTEGVSCFFPSAKATLARPISIVLESVKLFGGKDIASVFYSRKTGWYGIPDGLSLPYRYNNISFAFQAITLSPVDKILYKYQLQGANTNWSEWSEQNTINFSSLDPGKYTLTIRCKVNGEVQKKPLLRYTFSIKTPFHKSIWFVVCILGLAILCGVYLQYTANKRKQKRLAREDLLRREEQRRVRERTAEDFHDEVGNKLTRINVLTSVLKSKIDSANIDVERIIQQIQDNTQQLYAGTRDILWSLQPSNDNLYEVLNHVADLARELFSDTEVNFQLSGNDDWYKSYKMPLDKSRNFIMIWKEALNNSMKYSAAKQVLLQVRILPNKKLQVRLADDGRGFDTSVITNGNGLRNIKARAQRLGAHIEILSAKQKGTQIILTLPE